MRLVPSCRVQFKHLMSLTLCVKHVLRNDVYISHTFPFFWGARFAHFSCRSHSPLEHSEGNTQTVHSPPVEQLCKWPPVSPRNRPTHSRDASMGFVVVMERGWQWPDLESLLLWGFHELIRL